MIERIGPVESGLGHRHGRGRQGLPHRPDPDGADRRHLRATPPGLDLLGTVGATVAQRHLAERGHRSATRPSVLGSTAAERLGVAAAGPDTQVWLGGQLVHRGRHPRTRCRSPPSSTPRRWSAGRRAERLLDFDGHPTTVYTRSPTSAGGGRPRVLRRAPRTRRRPNEVEVSRPSDALAAKQATDKAFTALLLGLGAVALLVGGVGVANTMVISVLERRAEIGLRRSLGATRGQIRTQFLAESLLLSALGGVGRRAPRRRRHPRLRATPRAGRRWCRPGPRRRRWRRPC